MSDLDELRSEARRRMRAGKLNEAIAAQVDVINTAVKSNRIQVKDYTFLGAMFFQAKDCASAATLYKMAHERDADSGSILLDLGLCLLRLQRFTEALFYLKRAAQQLPDNTNLLSGLAEAFWRSGNRAAARVYGERALTIKDRAACAARRRYGPPGRRTNPAGSNVISFSLFGTQPHYWQGAIRNANQCAHLYPGWTCRFYSDDRVPEPVRAALQNTGAVLVDMGRARRPTDGLFWRFLVSDDPAVARFLVRDCDSLINAREQRAVNEWMASGKQFHVMRDYCTHTDLIQAGMWGGIAGMLPPIKALLSRFFYNSDTESRVADQQFLGRMVWPLIKGDCLIHDSLYRNFNAKPFPPHSELPPGRHVGDNDFAFQRVPQQSTPGSARHET